MAEGPSQRRAVTTGGRLEPIERDKVDPRPKTHYPFITKIQVRIKREDVNDGASKSDTGQRNTSRVLRPTNYTYREPSVCTLSSRETFYEDEEARVVPRRESLEELHRQRRKTLGERASASYLRNNNNSLYRPRLTAKDCEVQLLLVRELTGHLEDVERDFRRSRRLRRLPAFHSRATKGERVFGNRIWDSSQLEQYASPTAVNSLSTRRLRNGPLKNS